MNIKTPIDETTIFIGSVGAWEAAVPEGEWSSVNFRLIPSPEQIFHELGKYIKGQEDAKKTLAITSYNHLLRLKRNQVAQEHLASPPRLTVLITGPTGTGKTKLCNVLGNYLNVPFYHIDASFLSSPHGTGDNIQDHLKEYATQNRYKELKNYGIIYVDEVDKLFQYNPNSGDNNSTYNNHVVASLLTYIDGTNTDLPDLDTSKLLFIFSGSFEYINKLKSGQSRPIGFKTGLTQDSHAGLSREEIEEYSGIPREFLARLNVITQTYKLSRDEIRDILTNCIDAIIPQFEATFLLSGEKIDLSSAELDAIIEKIYESKYGMRYCKSVVFEHFKDKIFTLKS